MMALPVLIKTTYIKVQEETDLRVLAEETRDKLEREIQEVCIYHLFYWSVCIDVYIFFYFFNIRIIRPFHTFDTFTSVGRKRKM